MQMQDNELVTKLSFKISGVIAEKGKAYSNGEFTKSFLKLFMRRVFPEKKYVKEQLSLSGFTVIRTKVVSNR